MFIEVFFPLIINYIFHLERKFWGKLRAALCLKKKKLGECIPLIIVFMGILPDNVFIS